MIASAVAKGKENGKSADNESTTTTIISLSQQMAHKHSRRAQGGDGYGGRLSV